MNFSVQKTSLKEMLARSAAFQTAVGASGSSAEKIAAAKEKIFLSAYVSDSIQRPFALISKNSTDQISAIGGGETQQYNGNGEMEVQFERSVPDEFLIELESGGYGDIDPEKTGLAEDDFEQFYGACINEINALAGTEGYLFIRGWKLIEGPAVYQSSGNQKNIYYVKMLCKWGLE